VRKTPSEIPVSLDENQGLTLNRGSDTVKVFRAIKEKIAKETEKMNYEQFKAYLKKNQIEQVVKL